MRSLGIALCLLCASGCLIAQAQKGNEYYPASEKLETAIIDGDLQMLRQVLEADPRQADSEVIYNAATTYGKPIHLAAVEAGNAAVAVLVEKGADVNAGDKYGYRPLSYAIEQDNVALATFLLEHGATTGPPAWDNGPLPLAQARSIAMAKLLLDHGAHLADPKGLMNALHAAIDRDHVELVTLFLDKGGDVNMRNSRKETPLRSAVCGYQRYHQPNFRRIVALLRDRGALVEGEGAIQDAALTGDLAQVKRLVEQDAAAAAGRDQTGMTPLGWAACGGHLNVVSYLLARGAQPTNGHEEQLSALHWAVACGHQDVTALLIENGYSPNPGRWRNDSPLHVAVYARDRRMAVFLMDHGANPETWEKTRFGPLHLACRLGCAELVELFLARGSKGDGWALHAASASPSLETVRLLVAHGVDVDASRDDDPGTPLLSAVLGAGPLETVRFLLGRGADVNAHGRLRTTPLHEACWHRDLAMVRLLVDSGADVNATDEAGRTPLRVAKGWRDRHLGEQEAIVELLRQRGAQE